MHQTNQKVAQRQQHMECKATLQQVGLPSPIENMQCNAMQCNADTLPTHRLSFQVSILHNSELGAHSGMVRLTDRPLAQTPHNRRLTLHAWHNSPCRRSAQHKHSTDTSRLFSHSTTTSRRTNTVIVRTHHRVAANKQNLHVDVTTRRLIRVSKHHPCCLETMVSHEGRRTLPSHRWLSGMLEDANRLALQASPNQSRQWKEHRTHQLCRHLSEGAPSQTMKKTNNTSQNKQTPHAQHSQSEQFAQAPPVTPLVFPLHGPSDASAQQRGVGRRQTAPPAPLTHGDDGVSGAVATGASTDACDLASVKFANCCWPDDHPATAGQP